MSVNDVDVTETRYDAGIPDFSDPGGDDFEALSRDLIEVRSMTADDLDAIVRIDRKLTGRDRHDYYSGKLSEMMGDAGVRVSLVAVDDGMVIGFIMARVDYGEYGRAEPAAVIDTIGVYPGLGGNGVAKALMSQLLANLSVLQVETVRTTVRWNNFSLLGYLNKVGFKPAQQLVMRHRLT